MTSGLYLDDLAVGDTFESGTHEMTEEAIIAFAREFDPQPFHVDPEAARDSFFGELVASGWHTAAVTMRLVTESVTFSHGVIGAGGMAQWPNPTRPGDLLRVRTRIEDIVPSQSRPGRAAVHVRCLTLDAHGEVKQDFSPRLMSWKRGADVRG